MLMNLIIQLISGAVGGNIVGGLLKQLNLGPLGNTIAGVVGGGIGGQLISAMTGAGGIATATAGAGAGGVDIGSIISQIVGSGAGGGILMAIVGVIRQQMSKT